MAYKITEATLLPKINHEWDTTPCLFILSYLVLLQCIPSDDKQNRDKVATRTILNAFMFTALGTLESVTRWEHLGREKRFVLQSLREWIPNTILAILARSA